MGRKEDEGVQGMKDQETGGNCVMKGYLICTPHQIFLGWTNHREWACRDMWEVGGRREMHKCIKDFSGWTWSRVHLEDVVINQSKLKYCYRNWKGELRLDWTGSLYGKINY